MRWLTVLGVIALAGYGIVFSTLARAQVAINPAPQHLAVCPDKADAYKLALADMQNTLAKTWEEFVKEGRCRFMPAQYLFTIDNYKDNADTPSRVVEMLAFGEKVWGIRSGLPKVGVWEIRDTGQWEDRNEDVRKWFRGLMQPDNPTISCCGEADAYWADKVVTRDGKNYAVITDDRADAPLNRPHVPMGTEILIPNHKYKWDWGNPTGHNVIFISKVSDYGYYDVYCFVDGTGT
jgi:hypothetical protein